MRRALSYNALGFALPALLALASVPALTRTLGADRFGLLAVAWAAVAAFAALDLGLGRATSYLVARGGSNSRDVARGASHSRDQVVAGAGAWVWLIFGPIAVACWFAAPWMSREFLTVPAELADEAVGVLRWLALSIPVAAHGVVLRAALEGEARWGLVNLLRAPLGIITWGGPWLATYFTTDVRVLVAVICLGRVAYWLASWAALDWAWRAPAMRVLVQHGQWMTLSAIIAPILSLIDRAVVAARLPIAGVGWYVGTAETAGRISIASALVQPVMFQAMVADVAAERPLGPQLRRGVLITLGLVLPVAIPLAIFAPQLLPWWLADAFAPDAVPALRLFVLALVANGVALVAYAALQAAGRAREVALVHLAQLVVYVPLLIWAAVRYGGLGASVAWSARSVLDAVLLWMLVARRRESAR